MELERRKINHKGFKRNELVNILQEKMTQEILVNTDNSGN
jgi:hypothetical protein